MRPLGSRLSLYSSHIFVRNSIYFYRTDIPSDLKHYFHSTEIKQSLKTKDCKNAKALAVSLEYRVQQTFCMLRTGMLPDDLIKQVLAGILPSRQKAAVVSGKLLSEIVEQYVAEKESGWTYKTKLEVVGCLRLVVGCCR
jgi:hypothetical protein